MSRVRFEDVVLKKGGFLRGPFGGDLKKEIFVPKAKDTYKVYEQGVVLQKDSSIGRYYISSEYFENKMSRFEVKERDFLVSCSGVNYGAIFQLKGKIEQGVINQALLRIRIDNDKLADDFFYYYFQSLIVKMIVGRKGDSTIPNFPPLSVIKKLEFDIPCLKEQERIGSLLKDLDAKIEINNKINAELEAMAKLVYDYWFVQFDYPDDNGNPYKSSGGKMVYNKELKRAIPEGWEIKDIQDLGTCIMGQSPKGESYNQEGIGTPLLNGPADYENGSLKGRTFTTQPTRLCQEDDLVLCIRATIGNLVYSEQEFCLGRGVAAVRPISNEFSEYIYYLLEREIEVFKVRATGSIIKGITKDDLTLARVPVPNGERLKEFSDLVKPQFDKIRLNKKENLKLAELRDWLLPMLMNGQIKVK